MKPLAVVFWLTIFLSLWPSARTSGAQGTAIGDPAAEPRDTISSDSTEGLQSMLRNTKTAVLNYSLGAGRSDEHTSELQSLMRSSYAVFCLKKNKELLKCKCQEGNAPATA